MTEDYCKLVSGIILSTIWREDDHTRILWITMLAVKSRNHEVLASVPGLAAVANIPIEACRKSLHKLMQPDPDSRTKDHEGRRIAEIDGGWIVLNGEKYRNFLSKQERNEYQAKLMAARRENEKLAGVSKKLAVLAHTEAEAEAETNTDLEKKRKGATLIPSLRNVIAHGSIAGISEADCRQWFKDRSSEGWADKNGVDIGNWKAWLNRWRDFKRTDNQKSKSSKPESKQIQEEIVIKML